MKSIAQLLTRRHRYNDLSVSIREHIEEKIEDLMESGMPRAQAEQARHLCRDPSGAGRVRRRGQLSARAPRRLR